MNLLAATRSELTKQFSTAIWWILAIVLVGYVAFVAAAIAGALGGAASGALPGSGPAVPAAGLAPVVYSTGTSVGYVFPLLIGTLIVTSEFRHKTLTPTFLAVPRRGRVLIAKLLVGVVFGLIFGLLAAIASVGAGAGVLSIFGIDTALGSSDTWAMIGRMLIATVLWTLIGIGVGATVRNQVATIVIVLAFTQFIEPIGRVAGAFVQGLGDVLKYLPGSAADALVGSSAFSLSQGGSSESLTWWVGALVLLAYAIVFVVIGQLTSWRRDID